MIGQSSPTVPAEAFVAQVAEMQRRIADLERALQRGGDQARAGARRNMLDNGAQRVIQRGASLTSVSVDTTWIDRWALGNSNAGVYTMTNQTLTAFGVPLPTGNSPEKRCSAITTTTTDTLATAGDYLILSQLVEGRNLQHLLWGTSAAKPVTFSGWVYVTVGGIHYAELAHNVSGKVVSKPFTFVAGWNYFSATFPGLTTDQIPDNNSSGIVAQVWVAAGSTWSSGTHPGVVWHNTSANRVPGQSKAIPASNGRVFGWTEWQLEVGSVGTPFEVVDFAEEFRRCRRYFQVWNDPPARGVISGPSPAIVLRLGFVLPDEMRAAPTITITGGSVFDGSSTALLTSSTSLFSSTRSVEVEYNLAGALIAGQPAILYLGSGSRWDLSAIL